MITGIISGIVVLLCICFLIGVYLDSRRLRRKK